MTRTALLRLALFSALLAASSCAAAIPVLLPRLSQPAGPRHQFPLNEVDEISPFTSERAVPHTPTELRNTSAARSGPIA